VEHTVTKPKKSDDPLDEAVSKLMWATMLMKNDIERGLVERGLTGTRAQALWAIFHREPVTQRELATALNVTPRNVTTLVDALEDGGFVKRRNHPIDRRATHVDLTSKGRAAVLRMKTEKLTFARNLFGNVAAPELRQFVRMLDRVIARLEKLRPDPDD
jgi:DNA-binding MarR family transcriptional regulator